MERTLLIPRDGRGGEMSPLHVRGVDERIIVSDGRLTIFAGARTIVARKGDTVDVAAGEARTYRVDSDSARWLVLTSVQSVARYEDFGRALAVPVGNSWTPEDEATVGAIAAANGIELLGPPGTLPADLVAGRAAA
jgi:hypothetical protein